uniref:Uncharacterized protein n=1 Tax=Romanomermis culicivorax TaxID=13658 RepID=A0A915IQG9_ROMCU
MLVGFDTESLMAANMKNFKFTITVPANTTASSYPRYVQLVFLNGTIFVFETFTATPEDWTPLFFLVDGHHTIVISLDGADDWAGIYALLGNQFHTDRQKKNKDAVVKVIHFDAYRVICNINSSLPLYELAQKISFIPKKHTLKATVSAIWAFNVSRLTLKFSAALRFLNNPSRSFLQQDILAYAVLDAFYPILLFLAFGCYSFVPEVYHTPMLFPHDSLDAAEMDNLAEMLITAFHNLSLMEGLPADAADRVYPTLSQVTLPAIMRDEVLSAYQFFM